MKTYSCPQKLLNTLANLLLAMRLLVLFVHKHPEVLYPRVCEHRMCGKSKWAHSFFVRLWRKVSYCTANAVLDKQKVLKYHARRTKGTGLITKGRSALSKSSRFALF